MDPQRTGKRPLESGEVEQPAKATKTTVEGTPHQSQMQIVPSTGVPSGQPSGPPRDDPNDELHRLPVENMRLSLTVNPTYLAKLKARQEIGYRRSSANQQLEVRSVNIDVEAIKDAMTDVLNKILFVRFHAAATRRPSDIEAVIKAMVPLTVDVCISALYAKLRNINRSYGKCGGRYTTTPSYAKEIEIPYPLALAISEFGMFETHSLEKNVVMIPTFPEGIVSEGRSNVTFPSVEYASYVPIYNSLSITMKSVDSHVKAGTPWWTFHVNNVGGSTDLAAPLPRSHYTENSALLRALFCAQDKETNECKDIIEVPATRPRYYGTLMRRITYDFNLRIFSGLIHGPREEWEAKLY